MAKSFSVFVEINGGIGASLGQAIGKAESQLRRLSGVFKQNAIAAKSQVNEIAESYKGLAKMAAAGGVVFSVKHAFEGGAELAHELSNLKNAGRTAQEVADGLKAANQTIRDMPTASLTNSVKLLNETTGAYGVFKHAVENLGFNSKLGDVLKNSLKVEDPAHELGSLVKTLEIRGSAGNAERYKEEAARLGQAMVFYGGRLKSDDLYTFASNATTGIKQLDDRFLTRIAPALIQEQGGDKVGTGLTAFRTIISGRKITDKKQAEAWRKLGLLNDKDLIRNKMGDVTGWKDGAIVKTSMAYADPFEFMEKVILPRLKSQGVDINDQVKLGQALNTLFKNTKANAFVTMLSTQMDILRLHKDEDLMNKVPDLGKIYNDSVLNDPVMAQEAIKSAMSNIGSSLTLPLMKPFAQTMISLASAFNKLSAALIDNPGTAALIAKIGAGLMAWQAIRFANLAFGIGATARVIGNLSLALPLDLASRILATSTAIASISIARLRALVAGTTMLYAVGGRAAVLSALGASLATLGKAVMLFPVTALRAIGLGMWALVANPVGLALTAIVGGLTALGVWVYNNWGGIVSFFGAFGESFVKALGPGTAGLISTVAGWLGTVWNWLSRILGPLDESGEKWKAWGEWAGKGAAAVVNAITGLPGMLADLTKKAFEALVGFNWASAGVQIASSIASGLGGLASAPLNWLKGKLGIGGSVPKLGAAVPLAGARALGGPVTKGLPYLVGERGPEIFVPEKTGVIETNGTLKGLAAGARGGGALAIGVDSSSVDEAGRRAKHAGELLRNGLDTAVMPVVYTGAIDEANRRAEMLRATLDAIKASGIVVASNGGVSGLGGLGGGLSDAVGGGGGGFVLGGGGGGGYTASGFGSSLHGGRQGFMERHRHFGGRRAPHARMAGDGGGAGGDLKTGPIAKFKTGKLFEQKAPQVMARLERDFGLSRTESAAILGNLGHESAGFKAFEEGGHGPGRGWAQWTDPGRKRRFFEFAKRNGLDPKSDEANYGFLKWELQHTHKSAIAALKAPGTPEAKMQAFELRFEGAGVKNYASRMRYMKQALASAEKAKAVADKDPALAAKPSALPKVASQAAMLKVAGARAMGGPVGAGLSYLVGERGPEIFTPGASGGISTNDALGRLRDVGRAVMSGEGAESVAPSAARVAGARRAAQGESGRSFHAGDHTHHWHIDGGGNPHEIRRQVEGCFSDLIRQMESAQSGSLSD